MPKAGEGGLRIEIVLTAIRAEFQNRWLDDMPAHVRSVLTQSALTIPVSEGHCLLGTWQGIYTFGSIAGMATHAR